MATKRRRTLKATFTLDAELVARINAVALLRGQSRDALATAAFEEAVKGLVLFDRGRPSRRAKTNDRLEEATEISSEAEEEAA